jgi:hypothetical protein
MRRKQLVAHVAVGLQDLLAAAVPDQHGGIEGRPVLDLHRHGARELQRLVVRLGRERDDEVEGGVVELAQRVRVWRVMSMPISSIAAAAKASGPPARTPADST